MSTPGEPEKPFWQGVPSCSRCGYMVGPFVVSDGGNVCIPCHDDEPDDDCPECAEYVASKNDPTY